MYQQQLINLLHTFNETTGNRYRLNRLFNDSDYRNECLAKESVSGNNKLCLLVKQIQIYEDLLGYELRVSQVSRSAVQNRVFNLAVFALCSLLCVGGLIYTFEEIKHQRYLNSINKN